MEFNVNSIKTLVNKSLSTVKKKKKKLHEQIKIYFLRIKPKAFIRDQSN